MKNSFELRPDGEVTQVEFWNLYKDTFWPYRDVHTLLTAGEVIGKLSTVFPNAQAMVLPGMPQRFVVRGLVRKPETRFLCAWEHNQCPTAPFQSRGELVEHVHGHITERVEDEFPCLWASCSQAALPKASLWPHVATHLPGPTLPGPALSEQAATTFSVPRAINDPTPTSLTALLCIRLLFHLSHSAAGSAPRLDADHFGFPGTVEEDEDEVIVIPVEDEAEGEQRGRKAFISIRHLLERVQIKDDALTGWIAEMLEAATYSPSI
jgi:chromatin structure-remodeling complex subunit RSC9